MAVSKRMALLAIISTIVITNGLNKYQENISPVPGLSYLSSGYNIMFGNPHTSGDSDKGIKLPIWDFSNTTNGRTYNGDSVPNGVTIPKPVSTCAQTFSFHAVTGSNSYSKSLQQSTSFDASYFKAAFSASTDYQHVYTQTSKNKLTMTSSHTQCGVYSAALELPNTPPAFTENFYIEIENMPNFYDNKNQTNLKLFYDFFTQYFGTHYITDITMGGIFGQYSYFDSYSYSTYSSSNLDIAASASYSTVFASAAVHSLTNTSKQEASDFNSVSFDRTIFNIGGNLPSNGNWSQWQQDLAAKPMPISYTFQPIPNLLTAQYFPKITDIAKKQSALQSALNDYCAIIASNSSLAGIDCDGYPPDPTIPGKSIVKGFYTSNIGGSSATNPYTGGNNCPPNFDHITWAETMTDPGKAGFDAFYCINSTMKYKDGLNYFGGVYQTCCDINTGCSGANEVCLVDNAFTPGKCDCPAGYTKACGGFTWRPNPSGSKCPYVFQDGNYIPTRWYHCYNKSAPLTVMGGFYTPGYADAVNPHTGTMSCPTGSSGHYQYNFTAYKVINNGCGCISHNNNNACCGSVDSFVCLGNIYPV